MVEPDSENCEEYQGDLHNDVNLGKARVWHLLVEKILQDQEGEADGSSRNNLGKHNVNPDSWPLIQNTVVDREEGLPEVAGGQLKLGRQQQDGRDLQGDGVSKSRQGGKLTVPGSCVAGAEVTMLSSAAICCCVTLSAARRVTCFPPPHNSYSKYYKQYYNNLVHEPHFSYKGKTKKFFFVMQIRIY